MEQQQRGAIFAPTEIIRNEQATPPPGFPFAPVLTVMHNRKFTVCARLLRTDGGGSGHRTVPAAVVTEFRI